MSLLTHVHLGSNDVERSKKFYDAIFDVLGGATCWKDADRNRWFYMKGDQFLVVGEPLDREPTNVSNGFTIGFSVDGPEQGDAWVKAGLENGGSVCEGVDPPGLRDRGDRGQIYLAYLRDPDGHKLCALKRL